ncbi:carbonic anhydrase [Mycobacterium marinum]|uniref:carbonic anhydrase n=1 Tax=Mycobacterium marinum TaxID=1781 RepID=UPI000E3C4703|nr:carbonic anhydrase [Mycobacterium marinum]MDC8972161.1 carbonic anhydrase [Mycobacterium marinum]MDC8982062.1 carbonic anhydrase [Mycobacterium marinum]MDC8998784.1 carbonic anhydrase [Mycobacterium marinum]MDC9009709.1 carbonic anhydrase [Mycobacterium marinum]QQW33147.1 carbonic anhydrase [Mycobacterium marinum]
MSNPSTVWSQLQAGNRFFRNTLRTTGKHPAAKQSPSAVVFRCADADTASEAVFGQAWGSLIDVSNWGHVIDSGVLATVEYAVGALHTPLIVVLGHEHCTAMKTALDSWNSVSIPEGASRAVVEQAMSSLARQDATISAVDELAQAHAVHTGSSLLHKSPVVAKAVDAGECAIICLVSDSNDGRLRVCATFGNVSESGTPLLECV